MSYFALPSTRRSHVKRSFEGLFILELPLQLFKPHNVCSTALHVITISKPSVLQQAYIYLTHFRLSRFFLSVRSGLGFFPPLSCQSVCALIQATLPEAFAFLKSALNANQVCASDASVNQIKLSCQCYPRVLWEAVPTGQSSSAAAPWPSPDNRIC